MKAVYNIENTENEQVEKDIAGMFAEDESSKLHQKLMLDVITRNCLVQKYFQKLGVIKHGKVYKKKTEYIEA